ncbi:hypothetical protein, partial [Klebsiella pneumoniae]|uniref:hypothetical protein n=1 Tax=Klebsiella pneumoniae TaxID=573 RepID=UPI0039C191A1
MPDELGSTIGQLSGLLHFPPPDEPFAKTTEAAEIIKAADPLGFFEPPEALVPAGLDPLGFFEPPEA